MVMSHSPAWTAFICALSLPRGDLEKLATNPSAQVFAAGAPFAAIMELIKARLYTWLPGREHIIPFHLFSARFSNLLI